MTATIIHLPTRSPRGIDRGPEPDPITTVTPAATVDIDHDIVEAVAA